MSVKHVINGTVEEHLIEEKSITPEMLASQTSANGVSADQKDALDAASTLSGTNPVASMADVGASPYAGTTPDAPIALAPVDYLRTAEHPRIAEHQRVAAHLRIAEHD